MIKCVIDINPQKQKRYIAGTGHQVIPPAEIGNYEIENIIIMNENYFDEIKKSINNDNIQLLVL